MLIGNRYSDNKLYRGIRYYDSLPLTSGDLHEYADILQMKNAFFMNNIIGSGTLNEPPCSISSAGVSLISPSVVLIDGDISLIQADAHFVSTEEIAGAGYSAGLVCIVGWYQSLTHESTLRAFGGVNNTILPNDIIDATLQIQVSTRYQLRWDKIIVDATSYANGEAMTVSIPARDESGALTGGSISLNIAASDNDVKVVSKPASMTYAVSDLYIVPILNYNYSSSIVNTAKAYRAVKPIGTTGFIPSNTEPTGEFDSGTIWYNPSNYKFRFYVEGVGFVPTASDLSLIQYNNTVNISSAVTTPSNIPVPIGISSYNSNDILQVIYNGAVLTEGQNYTIDNLNSSIILLNFTTAVGDAITFIDIKLVDSNTASSISEEFSTHVNTSGSSTVKGHVLLTDAANNNLGVERGVAATPKAVYAATTITDTVTSKRYRLTMTNGVLGTVEIS